MTPSESVTVRAPGKLFLMGEYAVLYGAPAIVQAVDRYVVVTIEPLSAVSSAHFEVHSLGAQLPVLKAHWQAESGVGKGALRFESVQPEHKLVITLLEALSAQEVIHKELGPVKCTVDSRALFHNKNKLGLGSSAAITHALCAGLNEYALKDRTSGVTPLPPEFVFNVHRAFQHGRGSGADVGAGVMGGTFSFRQLSECPVPEMNAITLPDALHLLPVWVGKPASTGAALGTLAEFELRHPDQFTAALTPLMELAQAATHALIANDVDRFVGLTEQYSHNLSEFGRTVGVNIMSEQHQKLRQLAASVGVVYKPSGAGNGDFGLGYTSDIKALRVFTQKAEAAGFNTLSLEPGLACHRI